MNLYSVMNCNHSKLFTSFKLKFGTLGDGYALMSIIVALSFIPSTVLLYRECLYLKSIRINIQAYIVDVVSVLAHMKHM